MTKRKPIKTTIKDAIEYWKYLVDEEDLSVDWSEADTHCWRCGYQKNLIRCHIIPDSLGGEDAPSNIFYYVRDAILKVLMLMIKI